MRGRTLFIFEMALAIWVMVLLTICCVYIWPNDEKIASWVQAIGSIGAIVGAAFGIAWQINDNAKRDRAITIETARLATEATQTELQNVLKALSSELSIYETTLSKLRREVAEQFETTGEKRFSIVYPEIRPRLAVYISCTAKLGLISDDELRSQIIRVYGELDAIFGTVNMNSRYAAASFEGALAAAKADKALKQLGPYLLKRLDRVIKEVEAVQDKIAHVVAPLAESAPMMISPAPTT